MALTLTNISSIILKGEHLLADKVYEEFTNAEYSSDSDKKGQRNHFTNDLYHLVSALQYRENHNIINTDTVNLYLELERRLGSYIDPYSLDTNYSPPAGVIILPGDQYKTFLSLLDTPDSYSTVDNYIVAVNPAQDGLIFINPSTIGGVTSLINGLHETGSVGKLGGLLTEATTIDVSNFSLTLSSADFRTFMRLSPGATPQWSAQTKDTLTTGSFTSNPSVSGGVTMSMFGNAGATTQSLNITLSSMKILDTKNHKGLVYNADYSAVGRLDDRWIPDWGSIHGMFENGLQIVGDGNIGLGGSLTDYTSINIGHFGFQLFSSFSGNDQMWFQMNSDPGGSSILSSVFSLVDGIGYAGQQYIEPNYYAIEVSKQSAGIISIELNPTLAGPVTCGIYLRDQVYNKGARYDADYHVNNASNPRWIPDKGYVDNAITAAAPLAYIFGTGSLLGLGTSPSPFYPNAGNGLSNSDVTNGIILGGALNRDTTIATSTFNMIFSGQVGPVFNKTTGGSNGNIAVFQDNGAITSEIVKQGDFHGSGIANYPNGRPASFVNTSDIGVFISRDMADTNPVLTVRGINAGGTAPISLFQNSTRGVFQINWDGQVSQTLQVPAVAGLGVGHIIGGSLRPTANSDSLIGLSVNPTFGTSTIATINTLVGGTGYTNGSYIATTTGGTGVDASISIVVSGGIVTSATLLNPGVNYTVADVLAIVGTGTGATVTVASITSYTGVGKISAKFYNAPIVLDTITTPTTFINGMIWQDGVHIYARIAGVTKQLD